MELMVQVQKTTSGAMTPPDKLMACLADVIITVDGKEAK